MKGITVDQVNFLLLISAGLIAYFLPFELLLISYAFLGPLHYLTEISWLHDRNYFSIHKADSWILTISSLVLLILGAAVFPHSAELVWLLLLAAFCAAFVKSWWHRLGLMLIGGALLVPWLGSTASYALAVMIPTVIHVFLFTLFFMLLGALRSKSMLGYVNSALFVLGAIVLLYVPPLEFVLWTSFVEGNYPFFTGIADAVSQILAYDEDFLIMKIASFLAFAYTYHYLNWFSKTSIIEWHHISSSRALVIGILYAVSVGLYLKDYALGLTVLLSLSFLHVVLEFPLNFKSMDGIWGFVAKGLSRRSE